jgi:hypothetical protein
MDANPDEVTRARQVQVRDLPEDGASLIDAVHVASDLWASVRVQPDHVRRKSVLGTEDDDDNIAFDLRRFGDRAVEGRRSRLKVDGATVYSDRHDVAASDRSSSACPAADLIGGSLLCRGPARCAARPRRERGTSDPAAGPRGRVAVGRVGRDSTSHGSTGPRRAGPPSWRDGSIARAKEGA